MTPEIDRWDGGFGWIVDPDEPMQRASHALIDDGAVWVIDPVETFDTELATTSYRTIPIVTNRFWREVALYHESDRTLIIPEAVGIGSHFRATGERLGVHPVLRPLPPRAALGGLEPDRILVGHGEGVFDDATTALREALDGARSRMFRVYATLVRAAAGM